MKSITISQAAFQAEIFFSFSRNRGFKNGYVEASITPGLFKWDYVDTSGDRKKTVVSKRIARDMKEFNSIEASDIVSALESRWGDFAVECIQHDGDFQLKPVKQVKNPERLLHDFFNSESDKCPLEATQQERLEKEFSEWVLKERPSSYSLQECLAELKFGRPSNSQSALDRFIRSIDRIDSEKTDHRVLFEELEELQGVVPDLHDDIESFKNTLIDKYFTKK